MLVTVKQKLKCVFCCFQLSDVESLINNTAIRRHGHGGEGTNDGRCMKDCPILAPRVPVVGMA